MSDWKLEDIYCSKDDERLQADLSKVESLTDVFHAKYFDCVPLESLKTSIVEYETIVELLKKISVYAFLYSQTRLNDQDATSFSQMLSERVSFLSSMIVFYPISVANLDESACAEACEIDPELAKYKSWIDDCHRHKNHLLASDAEEVLLKKHLTSREAWIRLHDEILARISINFDDEPKNLANITEIANSSVDADKRKRASCFLGAELKNLSFYITHIYNNIMLDNSIESKMKNYALPESFRHVENNIDQESVDFLTDSVVCGFEKTSHKYYKIKAKILGKTKLEYWDRNAPVRLSTIFDQNISYENACEYVLNMFAKFSSVFHEIAKDFIEKKWIDVYPKEGKASGAFSCSCSSDSHPYIMLNFLGKWMDVATLAHELGHGIHQVLSAKNGALLAETPITISEVASLFCERMLFEELLNNAKTNLEKIDLLCYRLDDTINTVMRQVAFFEFERECHSKRKERELASEDIAKIWVNAQKKYCGEFVNIDEAVSSYWCYISHFFQSPFYVYSYSFGEIFVNALYEAYQSFGESFVKKYVAMLERGGIDRYDVVASHFSFNPLLKSFWQNGVDEIGKQIDCLETFV